MMIIFFILLVLKMGRCTEDRIFETKTVGVGQNVTLTCDRRHSWRSTYLFWIRLVSETFPEILGGIIANNYDVVKETRHITAKQEPGKFVLYINKTQLSDTAVYYCMKVSFSTMTFSKGIFLRIKGPEPDITAVTQDFPSDPVRPGDSVTLQCSVLSVSEEKTCPEEHTVSWFKAGSDGSHHSVIYAQRNNSAGCEKSPEAHSPQKCVYSFSKNVGSSDAGTYYCAVATCGEILFGNGIELEVEETGSWSFGDGTFLVLLCAVFTISVNVAAVLIYAIKKNKCDYCNNEAAVSLLENVAKRNLKRNEDTWIYSAVVFTAIKSGRGGTRDAETTERERIYAAVKAFGLD
ncbi:signal-regulatory protein beta-2-like [Cebidichthys violaceus]|uniref:signal-regulatory protein beta-2-like n=1 Tax=Cebidichthys violaceus TaxID=271503 RepID=UPI0035CC4E16